MKISRPRPTSDPTRLRSFSNVCSTVSDLLQPAPSTISKGIIPRHYCIFIIPSLGAYFFLLVELFFSSSVDVFPLC